MIQKGIPFDQYTLGPTSSSYTFSGFFQDEQRAPRSREAEQWKELSMLFEDVIHELNQPVGIIGSTTKTLSNYIHNGNLEKAEASLKKLSVAVEDIGHRISVYKGLTQRSGEEETIRVRDLIVDVERVLWQQAKKAGVKIDSAVYDENENPWNQILYLRGDPFLYRMAIRALVHNAIQACSDPSLPKDRKHVIIRGMCTHPHDIDVPPHGWVEICVRDKGPGISSELREKIFVRGFTTKKGRGLGLGLSLVQSVADYYNGSVSLREEASPGVEFWLRFPAALPL